MLGVIRLQPIFVVGKVFFAGLCWMYMAPCSSSTLPTSGKGIRLCLPSVMVGVSGMVSCWAEFGVRLFLVGFVVLLMVMVTFFWGLNLSSFVEIRENPEFHDLMREHKSQWPRCLLWHGWLPILSGVNGASPWTSVGGGSVFQSSMLVVSPWAATAGDAAVNMLGSALGAGAARVLGDWEALVDVDWEAAAGRPPSDPDVWTDGSLVRDDVSWASFAGSGVYARLHVDNTWRHRRWGHLEDLGPTSDCLAVSCRGFGSLPGPLQTVQRAEFWAVILFIWVLVISM